MDAISRSGQKLFHAIKYRYPHLSDQEAAMFVDEIFDVIAKHLANGDTFAFLKQYQDGRSEIITYGLEQMLNDEKE